MAESITFENQQMDGSISERTLLGASGFTLALAALLMGIYSTALCTALTSEPVVFALLRGIALLAMAVTYYVLYRFVNQRDALARSSIAKTSFFALQALLPVLHLSELLFFIQIPIILVTVAWITWGVSTSYFMCSWIDGLSNIDEEKVGSVNFTAYLCASVLTICVLAMTPVIASSAYLVVIVASYLILLNARKDTPSPLNSSDDSASEKWLRGNVRFKKNGSYIMLVDGLLIANVACFVLAKVIRLELTPVLMGIALAGTVLLFALLRQYDPSLLSLETSQLLFLPVIVCGLMLMSFLVDMPQIAVALLLFIVLFVFELSNSAILSERGNLLNMSAVFCFAKGRVFMVLGQSIGWFIGAFLAASSVRYLPVLFTVFVFLTCLYITIAVLNPKIYPLMPEEPKPIEEEASAIAPVEENKGRPFKDKCTQATLFYNLTPREGEILFYLAKGRNAKFIADKLYVAERTVKTHTYHIYQKMEVHSQQELINIVENQELSS